MEIAADGEQARTESYDAVPLDFGLPPLDRRRRRAVEARLHAPG
jgi:hypothetical protein